MSVGGYDPEITLVRGGSVGIRKSSLDPLLLTGIRHELTVKPSGFGKHEPEPFEVFTEDDEFIWVPREYRLRFAAIHEHDETTLGSPADLEFGGKLLEERDQPAAFEWMHTHLKHNHTGILHAFTDFGKTYVSLALASEFKRRTAVVTHLGHMLDNWREVACNMLTYEPDEIGVVAQGQETVGDVTLFLAQTLTTKDYPPEFFEQFGFVIFDEVHHYGSREWQRVPGMFPGRYRLGVSATPERNDGLTKVVRWHCGPIAYRAKKRTDDNSAKTVVQVFYDNEYPYKSYCNWDGGEPGTVNPQKYRAKQSKDTGRNVMLVREMVNAFKAGRKGLVQTHYRGHAETLHAMFLKALKDEGLAEPKTLVLFGGARNKTEKAKQKEAHHSDWIFATFGYTREAISLAQIDTLIWATSPGDAAQALGRLRAADGKKDLLCLDTYENTDYGKEKAQKRASQMRGLGATIRTLKRRKVEVEAPKKKSRKSPQAARPKG